MAASTQQLFLCSHCDAQFQKWTGRCLECGKWGTIEKTLQKKSEQKQDIPVSTNIKKLSDIKGKDIQRIPTSISELDRVLGGGLVPGSLILLGGEPGIGKSTLSLQLAAAVKNTMYISGEESIEQIKLRYDRLQLGSPSLSIANETHVESIVSIIKKQKPALAIIDSIQTIYSDDATNGAGTPNQIRACTVKLMEIAKSSGTSLVIIGHVTKDGAVAGPKTLEHLVDTVLYFEGDRHYAIRVLRGVKNRFGSTDEVGMFEMNETGLSEITNPSAVLLDERGENMPGSVVTCLMEGTRPILVEVQALVNKTVFGYPQRKASGFDLNRLHVLAAVLERRAGLNLSQYDVHVNVVGGIKANEPAADLAVCLAIASAYKDKSLGKDVAVFGEVGLGGEIRTVRFVEKRMKECQALGMKKIITKLRDKKPGVLSASNLSELISKT